MDSYKDSSSHCSSESSRYLRVRMLMWQIAMVSKKGAAGARVEQVRGVVVLMGLLLVGFAWLL